MSQASHWPPLPAPPTAVWLMCGPTTRGPLQQRAIFLQLCVVMPKPVYQGAPGFDLDVSKRQKSCCALHAHAPRSPAAI